MDVSGFVLAGGRSLRLGQDKVLLPWNGRTLLQHAVDRLHKVCEVVRLCGNRPDLADFSDRTWIPDAVNGAGPLGGIVAALEQSSTDWNLFLAVDLPLVPVVLLKALVEQTNRAGPDSSPQRCILAATDGRPQPLCGLYHRDLAAGLKRALLKGDLKITLAIHNALAEAADPFPPALRLFHAEHFAASRAGRSESPANDWFLNINTQEEWRLARARAGNPPSHT